MLTNARCLSGAQAAHYQLLDLSTASCCMLGYHVCALTSSRRQVNSRKRVFRLRAGPAPGCQRPLKSREEDDGDNEEEEAAVVAAALALAPSSLSFSLSALIPGHSNRFIVRLGFCRTAEHLTVCQSTVAYNRHFRVRTDFSNGNVGNGQRS